MQPLRVPACLQQVDADELENYIDLRMRQLFNALFNVRPDLQTAITSQDMHKALSIIPKAVYNTSQFEQRELQLLFRHDCLAIGCLDPQCHLCQYNPSRRCMVNFNPRYLVGDPLRAKCGSSIRVEIQDRFTGQPYEDEIPGLKLEVYLLDGHQYETQQVERMRMGLDGGTETEEELMSCAHLMNKKKTEALLVCPSGVVSNNAQLKIIVPWQNRGPVNIPDLSISDSSEAVLSGRRPPFRLLVRAILPPSKGHIRIRHAISEGFIVSTRRAKYQVKVEVPHIEDPIGKIEHMGKETVKKLYDLRLAGELVQIPIDIPENCIQKVGEFKQLAMRAEQDGHLRHKLMTILKFSEDKWNEAKDHANRAVVTDNRLRAWYTTSCPNLNLPSGLPTDVTYGLVYYCKLGVINPTMPLALIVAQAGAGPGGELGESLVLPPDQQSNSQRELVMILQPYALSSWLDSGHPGWAILPSDSDEFVAKNGLRVGGVGPMAYNNDDPHNFPLGVGGGGGGGGGAGAGGGHAMGMQQEAMPIDESFFNGLMEQILAASAMTNVNDQPPPEQLQSPQPTPQPQPADRAHRPHMNPFGNITHHRRVTADPPMTHDPHAQAAMPPPGPSYSSLGGGGRGGGGQKQKRGLEVTPSVVERDDAAARRNTAASLGGHLPTGFSRGAAEGAHADTGAFQDPNTMTNGGMPNPFHTEQLSPHGLAHVVAGLSQGSGNTGGMGGGVGTGSVDSVHGDMDFDFGSLNIGPSLFQGSLPKEYQGLLDPGQGQGQGQGRGAVPAPPPSLLTSSPSRLHDVNMGAGHATAYVSTQGGGGGLANVTSGIKSLTSMPSGLAFNNSEISHIERIFGIGKPPASHGQQAGGGGQEASMNEGAVGTSNAQGGLLGGPGSLVLPVGLSSSLNLPVQMRHLVTTGSGLHNMQSIEQLGILGGDKRNL